MSSQPAFRKYVVTRTFLSTETLIVQAIDEGWLRDWMNEGRPYEEFPDPICVEDYTVERKLLGQLIDPGSVVGVRDARWTYKDSIEPPSKRWETTDYHFSDDLRNVLQVSDNNDDAAEVLRRNHVLIDSECELDSESSCFHAHFPTATAARGFVDRLNAWYVRAYSRPPAKKLPGRKRKVAK